MNVPANLECMPGGAARSATVSAELAQAVRRSFRPYSRFLSGPSYTADASGIAQANAVLDERRELHSAFTAQPDITPVWQGRIDGAARHVENQEAVIERLVASDQSWPMQKET
jgi:hypothetical protein